jgi:hypothetical protein
MALDITHFNSEILEIGKAALANMEGCNEVRCDNRYMFYLLAISFIVLEVFIDEVNTFE